MAKLYKVLIKGTSYSGRDYSYIKELTLEDCRDYFGYTLEIGHSWNKKINPNAPTMRGLVSAINKSFAIKYGKCMRTWCEIEIVK